MKSKVLDENYRSISILRFLKELKDSYVDIPKIFLYGSCFRLYKILKIVYPISKPYYSELDGHWITKIGKKYYDINGEINKNYIEHKKYKLIKDEIILQSAYIPTHKGQTCSYNKYKQVV